MGKVRGTKAKGTWRNKGKRSGINAEKIIGTISIHKNGFGFVTPQESAEDIEKLSEHKKLLLQKDIFIPKNGIKTAMTGDLVEVELLDGLYSRERRAGVVSKVLQRAIKEIVGTFEREKKYGFVVSDDVKVREDVFIDKKYFSGAKNGDKVVATIIAYPEGHNSAEGKITEIIARQGEPGADIKSLIRAKGMFFTFPSRAAAQAKAISKMSPEDEAKGRVDLRGKNIITIDGATSKDFDDAVSVEKLENGNYLLGVHIADVSHYVTADSPIDKEALKRGTSVYVLDYVVPMLPKELSNDICSLNPKSARLTLSVDMEITPDGEVVDHNIYESIISSKERMIYDDVSDMIEDDAEISAAALEHLKKRYSEIYEDIMIMADLAEILSSRRKERGSIDFDLDEAFIELDDMGVPVKVGISRRRKANRMIEEFMLLANQTVAEHFFWLTAPFVYRVHETPDTDRMEEFKEFLQGFGIKLKGSSFDVHPKTLADILKNIEGTEYENIVSSVMLRSMKKAYYDVDCKGHFGLALKYYCHFTSPIRRYPDLMIHRIIKEYLKEKPNRKRIEGFETQAAAAAELSSVSERRAMELERDVEKLKKCEYISYHIGDKFPGIISGVTNYGIYVQLENTIEGFVRIENMWDDYYEADMKRYRVIGTETGRIYSLGNKVTIKVMGVSMENREIDFILSL